MGKYKYINPRFGICFMNLIDSEGINKDIIFMITIRGRRQDMEQQFYEQIKRILSEARNKVYQTANFAMVEAYWNIGKSIVEQQDGYEKAEYGSKLISELSKQMTKDFGKGFTPTNLKYMRQFYLTFPIRHALRDELSWTHYRLLMRVENENARQFYTQEASNQIGVHDSLKGKLTRFFMKGCFPVKTKRRLKKKF